MSGTTLTLLIIRLQDTWVANVGDSQAIVIDPLCSTMEIVTADHTPTNFDEFTRIIEHHPNAVFEYDRVNSSSSINPIYRQNAEKFWEMAELPLVNCYYKNRNDELATYVGVGSDKIAMTRSIGDTRFKDSIGVIAEPYIKRLEAKKATDVILIATDGFWDPWTHGEIIEWCKSGTNFSGRGEGGREDMKNLHEKKATQYFGSSKDDSFMFIIE